METKKTARRGCCQCLMERWAIKFESLLSTKDCEEHIETKTQISTKSAAKAEKMLVMGGTGLMDTFKGNKKVLAYLIQYTLKYPLDVRVTL